MTVDAWLSSTVADAEGRGLPQLVPLVQTLARSTTALRAADVEFNHPAADYADEPEIRLTDRTADADKGNDVELDGTR